MRSRTDSEFADFVSQSVQRHTDGDWGDSNFIDKEANDLALKTGDPVTSIYIYTHQREKSLM